MLIFVNEPLVGFLRFSEYSIAVRNKNTAGLIYYGENDVSVFMSFYDGNIVPTCSFGHVSLHGDI